MVSDEVEKWSNQNLIFTLCQDLALTHFDFIASVTRIPHMGKSKLLTQPLNYIYRIPLKLRDLKTLGVFKAFEAIGYA
jgi:hypothetical protein